MKLKGAYVAIVTPFNDDMSVDYNTLENLVEFQIENGISGIVVCGSTGETATLTEKEYEKIIKTVIEKVVRPVLEKYNLSSENIKYYINPTGRFVIGGPHGDTGVTGRKIIVDTYGGYFRHGGGAFSGKDSSKVDRSAAYMARYIAKNIVASKIARKCEIQLSYAIGVNVPTSIKVDTFGTSNIENEKIINAITKLFDLSPKGIEKTLNLRKPNFRYRDLAALGHIGREDIELPWEQLDKVEELKRMLNV
mgnify:CR=1 FL=1